MDDFLVRTYQRAFISRFLLGLVLFDVFLTLWAFFFPELWFQLFHGAEYQDPQALLKRCGANWAAFALMQLIAFRRWEIQPYWLLIVAGVRLSDIFTDITCALLAESITPFGALSFGLMSPVNLLMGIYLIKVHSRIANSPR